MRSFFEPWRRHLWLWALPLSFCVLNLIGYGIYRFAFAGQVERLERRYQQMADQLAEIEKERQLIDEFLDRIELHETQVRDLYAGRFQTEAQRFTRVIQDIKDLAERAGLEPTTLRYPRKAFGEYGLVQRDIRFSVTGSYEQLRQFINFLELTDHFVALNSVSLGEGDRRNFQTINLELSTVFLLQEVAGSEELST